MSEQFKIKKPEGTLSKEEQLEIDSANTELALRRITALERDHGWDRKDAAQYVSFYNLLAHGEKLDAVEEEKVRLCEQKYSAPPQFSIIKEIPLES